MELGNVAGEARWDVHSVELRKSTQDKRRNLVGVKPRKNGIVEHCLGTFARAASNSRLCAGVSAERNDGGSASIVMSQAPGEAQIQKIIKIPFKKK